MPIFSCPKCLSKDVKSALVNSDEKDNLACSSCGSIYPVINEIPRLTDLTNYAESFGYQWNIYI